MKRALLAIVLAACGQPAGDNDAGARDAGLTDAGTLDSGIADAGAPDAGVPDAGMPDAGEVDAGPIDAGPPGPYAEAIVSFTPGAGAGYGQNKLPGVVLGPPYGEGDSAGSTDVLSLGKDGEIVLSVANFEIIDGPGVDLLVFENPFTGFIETGIVAVSLDGTTWSEFPCAAVIDGGTEGCAGVHPVYANPDNGISATDPSVAGGDGFDLAQLGLTHARYVRIRDSGKNMYGAPTGGFDLDAISVVNGMAP